MATPPAFFHALLRPCILQILRSTGYHATRPAVLDSLTDLAARYMLALCQSTASHAEHNRLQPGDFDVTDVRHALQDVGALGPEQTLTAEAWSGEEDLRGIEEFIEWFTSGSRFKELTEVGNADGESDATDYLAALKKKHNKTGDDAKFQGTILGRPGEGVEIPVEGGPLASIHEWMVQHSPQLENYDAAASPSASSGLSSVGDRLDGDEDMESMVQERRNDMDMS